MRFGRPCLRYLLCAWMICRLVFVCLARRMSASNWLCVAFRNLPSALRFPLAIFSASFVTCFGGFFLVV